LYSENLPTVGTVTPKNYSIFYKRKIVQMYIKGTVKQSLYRPKVGPEHSSRLRLPDYETICT